MTKAVVLLAALLVPQEQEEEKVEFISRTHPRRGAYSDAIRKCADAEKLIRANPRQAIQILDAILELDLKTVECRMRIIVKANEYIPKLSEAAANFKPYEFRGKAHLSLSRTLEGSSARGHLLKAVADLKESSGPISQGGRNNPHSRAPLIEARRLMWERLRRALAYATWDADDATLASQAGTFLSAWPEEARAAAVWLGEEGGRIVQLADRLKKDSPKEADTKKKARRMVQWCDGIRDALGGVDVLKKPLAALDAVREGAAWVVAYRGTFTLAISVYPFARIEKIILGGREIPLDQRATPVRIARKLEIADLRVVLSHPGLKTRKEFTYRGADMIADHAYVISGTMEGDSLLNFGSLE